ncbi:Retrovirus-related Pol polyprotein [Aphis craccivora]|uniref:Retrovirus-related Pol polyprotein n=1 Tax=Aphis craccivora TaxID=307492 RepID=A0A6G0ZEB6_APHCR|nr:Retrovirus-related Pol polyprotein [Aphis craccivora]
MYAMLTLINAEHIHCRSGDFVQGENKFLIDSCANMNIIKISVQNYHIIIKHSYNINCRNCSVIIDMETEKLIIPEPIYWIRSDNNTSVHPRPIN